MSKKQNSKVELNKGILGIVVLNSLKVVKFCLY